MGSAIGVAAAGTVVGGFLILRLVARALIGGLR